MEKSPGYEQVRKPVLPSSFNVRNSSVVFIEQNFGPHMLQ